MKVKGFKLMKKAAIDPETGKMTGWDDLFQALETCYKMPNQQPKADSNVFTIIKSKINDNRDSKVYSKNLDEDETHIQVCCSLDDNDCP